MSSGETGIAIVGGGPAGFATALALRSLAPRLAAETVVLEAQGTARTKPCAGMVSARAWSILGLLGIRVDVPGIPVAGARAVHGERVVEARLAAGLGRMVFRGAFDEALAREARRAGVDLREGRRVRSIRRESGDGRADGAGGRFVLEVEGEPTPLRCRVLVGADGLGSIVRRTFFPRDRVRVAKSILVETDRAPDDPPPGVIEFDLTRTGRGLDGYGWAFPSLRRDGSPCVNRGIYCRSLRTGCDLKRLLGEMLERRRIDPSGLRVRAHGIRPFDRDLDMARPGVILIGEAVGVDPATGEGIAQAFAYGVLAAAALAEAFGRGDLSFASWSRRVLASPMGRDLAWANRLEGILFGHAQARLAALPFRGPELIEGWMRRFAWIPPDWRKRLGLVRRALAGLLAGPLE